MAANLPGRHFIAAVVPRIIRMSLHLDDRNLMRLHDRQQPFPKILIFNGLLGRCFPAVSLPAVDPVLLKRIDQIGRIRIQRHGARLFERREPLHSGEQLHPVVRCAHKAAAHLLFKRAVFQDCAVAALARVAAACAVCKNFYFFNYVHRRSAVN